MIFASTYFSEDLSSLNPTRRVALRTGPPNKTSLYVCEYVPEIVHHEEIELLNTRLLNKVKARRT